ncbi:SpvB/TcaC N-terminal domain-containing protein [Flavobacterium sp. SM15]|uniref:SpvB/TcaC N-terminal domain-containing protein n=1 Tax=Flavobacterium sp. SM15 TaxID=2908005 RepID=UPI00272EBD15|nr:SpvB/TcaC N-terminal domain-containing protein [Flavobacterium sp. SM15]
MSNIKKDFNNNNYLGLNKTLVKAVNQIMLFSILHSSVVLPAQELVLAYNSIEKTKNEKKYDLNTPSKANIDTRGEGSNNNNAFSSTVPVNNSVLDSKVKQVYKDESVFVSDINEGVIGYSTVLPVDDPSDNLFKINISSLPKQGDKVFLKYELYGVSDKNAVARSINDRLSVGGYEVSPNQSWSSQTEEIDFKWLKVGENKILFTTPEGANYFYKIKNLKIQVERNKTNRVNSKVVLQDFDIKSVKNNKIYIKGFVKAIPQGKLIVEVENKPLHVQSEEFEGFVELTEKAKNNKFVVVRAYDDNGFLGQEILSIENNLKQAKTIYEIEGLKSFNKLNFKALEKNSLSLPGVSIEVADSALLYNRELSITELRHIDIAPLGSDLINTTQNGKAYRFLPDGTTFEKPVKITIAYDPKLMPKGYTAKDLKTYFFDTKTKRWLAVPTVSVDEVNHTITSLTTHFTDYINGIIQVPESPETNAYAPTSISDIKIANPGAKVNLIDPPTANQQGDANLSYPIEIPAGRKGMQPNLTVQYNSGGGNGWMGLGWNISIPSIELDTQWGSPLFSATQETEIYTLSGEQLMLKNNSNFYLPNRDNPINRISDAMFYPRVEAGFNQIQRVGNSPSNYSWIVTDKSGTKYFYGSTNDSKLTNGNGTTGNIVRWMLKKVVDINGNYVEYNYILKTFTEGTMSGGKQLYLSEIQYTGHSSLAPAYSVVFNRNTSLPGGSGLRDDKSINARLGFKEITYDVLDNVVVKFGNQIVRKYSFKYRKGQFGKTLLEKIQQLDADDVLFNEHILEYYDDTNNGQTIFGNEEQISGLGNDVGGIYSINSSTLGASHSNNYGGGLGFTGGYASLADPLTLNPVSQYGTGGIFGGLSGSDSKGKIAFLDIDGDGLPDKVIKSDSNGLSYRKNLGNGSLSSPKSIFGVSEFSRSSSSTKSLGTRANFFGIFAGVERSWTTSSTYSYMEDVNGDGLMDVVNDKKVFFNTMRPNGADILPTFNDQSAATPNVIYQDLSTVPTDPTTTDASIENYLYDVVRVWEAPYSGTISIAGNATLLNLPSGNSTDGVRFSIEKGNIDFTNPPTSSTPVTNAPNYVFPSYPVILTSSNTNTAINITNVAINKGQRIFFRANSVSNDVNDHLNINPTITYTNQFNPAITNANQIDANGFNYFNSSATNSFILSADQRVMAPHRGTYSITWPSFTINNPVPTPANVMNVEMSDEVEFVVTKHIKTNNNGTITETQTVLQRTRALINTLVNTINPLPALSSISIPSSEIDNDNSDNITKEVSFSFKINAYSNVDWKKLHNKWNPSLSIPESSSGAGDNSIVYPTPNLSVYNSIKTTNTFVVPPAMNTGNNTTRKRYNMQPVFPTTGTGTSQVINFGACTSCPTGYVRKLYLSVKGATKNLLYDNGTGVSNNLPANPLISLAKYEIKIDNNGNVLANTGSGSALVTGIRKFNVVTGLYDQNVSFTGPATPLPNRGVNIIFEANNSNSSPLNARVYFEYFTDDEIVATSIANVPGGAARIKLTTQNWPAINVITNNVQPNIYVKKGNNDFGARYNGWGQFAYKTEKDVSGIVLPLKESELIPNTTFHQPTDAEISNCASLPDNQYQACIEALNPQKRIFSLSPSNVLENNIYKKRWVGTQKEMYVEELLTSPKKQREEAVAGTSPVITAPTSTGAWGIVKKTKSTSTSGSASYYVGAYYNSGNNHVYNDHRDVNGDRYPDLVDGNAIRFTNNKGGFSTYTTAGYEQLSKGTGYGASTPGSLPKFNFSAGNSTGNTKTKDSSSGSSKDGIGLPVSGTFGQTEDESKESLMDINGDGLVDKVEDGGNVKLNLGTISGFEGNTSWGFGDVNKGKSTSLSLGGGISLFNNSVSAGLSLAGATSYDKETFTDINGDGLPDKIVNQSQVLYNFGTTFSSSAVSINNFNSTRESVSYSGGINAGFTYCYYFLVPIVFTGPKFCGCGDGNGGKGLNSERLQLSDINGDGYSDILVSDSETELKVRYSKIGRTNMLKSVKRPLGAIITMDYAITNPISGTRVGNTYKMPFSKWVMTSVIVNDGFVGDGQDNIVNKFEYLDGYQDRRERQFIGFGVVKTHNMKADNTVYRTAVTEYVTANIPDANLYRPGTDSEIRQYFYKKGIVSKTYMLDGVGRKHNETENIYKYFTPNIPSLNTSVNDYSTLTTPSLTYTDKSRVLPLLYSTILRTWAFSSDSPSASSHLKQVYTTVDAYDKFGNVKVYQDKGENQSDLADDIKVEILYHYNFSNYNITVPQEHKITNQGVQYRKSRTFVDSKGQIIEIRKYLTNSLTNNYALYNLKYDIFGNLGKIMHPKGALSDSDVTRMSYDYVFDAITATYITDVYDAYGYTSHTDYRYDFGLPIKTIDTNANLMEFAYDTFGRPIMIKGPYDSDWTIKNAYGVVTSTGTNYAYTGHKDGTGTIFTSTFVDGLQRVVQTKKEMQLCDCPNSSQTESYRFSVSGKVKYDEFGRANESYLNYDEKNCQGNFMQKLRSFTSLLDVPTEKTTVEYDYLDRAVKTTLFGIPAGNAVTLNKYSFDSDREGATQFTQETILPEGNRTINYIDSKGRTTSSKQMGSEDLWTSFEYNKLSELIRVKDANEHITYYAYDNFGRKLSVNHPDAGLATFKYDLASRLKESTNANLAALGQKVMYNYNINQITSVVYPSHTVVYEYGAPGAPDNSAGRIVYQSDLTGMQYFKYGRLGEITENKRIVVDPITAPRTFTTYFGYDTWGRIRKLVYPDGEIVQYEYDNGGLLKKIFNSNDIVYLKNICYDQFEQRKEVQYGNDTFTNYEYEPQRRLQQLKVKASTGEVFMNSNYQYDKNSNVTNINNINSGAASFQLGGTSHKEFAYDPYNRLISASGMWSGHSEDHEFSLVVGYNALHNIVSKTQIHQKAPLGSGAWAETDNTFTNNYTYNASQQPHAPATIEVADATGYVSEQILNTYDLNGNLKQIEKEVENVGSTIERQLYWDEQNRLQAIVENEIAHHYIYDAAGGRILKSSGSSANLNINGDVVVGMTNPGTYTLYPSGYLVLGQTQYTKHYYAGSQRIASQLGNNDSVNGFIETESMPLQAPQGEGKGKGKGKMDAATVLMNIKKAQQKQIRDIYNKAKLGAPNFDDNDSVSRDSANDACYQELVTLFNYHLNISMQGDFPENKKCAQYIGYLINTFPNQACNSILSLKEKTNCYIDLNTKSEPIWWYHPDHLGSSSYLSDWFGKPSHYYDYLPFGEEMISQTNSSYNNIYKFNGKELDEETGLYYYGARYYNPKWSFWLSVDPLAEKYPNIGAYVYCAQNPINLIDPDGRDWVEGKDGNITWRNDVNSKNHKDVLKEGEIYRGTDYVRYKEWNNNKAKGLVQEHYKSNKVLQYEKHNGKFQLDFSGDIVSDNDITGKELNNAKHADDGITGKMYLNAVFSDGGTFTTETYDFTSGPYGNGPTPNKNYTGSAFARTNEGGMQIYGEMGWKVYMEDYNGRDGLRIHPDTNGRGTKGCIGINGAAQQLKDLGNFLEKYIKDNKTIKVNFNIPGNPNYGNNGKANLNIRQ